MIHWEGTRFTTFYSYTKSLELASIWEGHGYEEGGRIIPSEKSRSLFMISFKAGWLRAVAKGKREPLRHVAPGNWKGQDTT